MLDLADLQLGEEVVLPRRLFANQILATRNDHVAGFAVEFGHFRANGLSDQLRNVLQEVYVDLAGGDERPDTVDVHVQSAFVHPGDRAFDFDADFHVAH